MMTNNFAPEGFIPCDGRLLNIADYQALYSVIGSYYGGDGSTTFAVPDLRGRSATGDGQGTGLTYKMLGNKNGSERENLDLWEMPVHTHNISTTASIKCSSGKADSADPSQKILARSEVDPYISSPNDADLNSGTLTFSDSTETLPAGGGMVHSNMMPYTVINYYISYDGYYPPRPSN